MRLIDADKFKNQVTLQSEAGTIDTLQAEAICKIIDAHPTVKQSTWIPCSEKSPEYTGEYNATVGMSGTGGYYEEVTTLPYLHTAGESRWMIPKSIDLDPFILTVIAWMPLPDPYTESVEE